MTQEDLTQIETALAIKLPAHYCLFMLAFPTELTTIHQEFEDEHYAHFMNEANKIIALNQLLGCYGEDKMIKRKLCIGENGGGDYYLIDLHEHQNETVYYFDHEEAADHYNQTTARWNWEAFAAHPNLIAYQQELITMFGTSDTYE